MLTTDKTQRKNTPITVELVKECFSYNPMTGSLIWNIRKDRDQSWNSRYANKEALNAKNGRGYLSGTIHGKPYRKHRIIWLWMTGEHPKYIDHINHDKTDNRWCNLRNVSKQENEKNIPMHKSNTSGVTGVFFDKTRNKWVGRCNKIQKRFNNFEDAVSHRKELEILFGYHPNHGEAIASIDT